MTREMKNSGVEWIGNIPSEWKIRKIKNVCSIYTGNSIKDNEKNNFTDSTNAIPYIATKEIDASSSKINYNNGMYIKRDDENFKVAPKNSTLMCIEGGSAGKKIAYLNQDVCFVNKLCCFSAKSLDDKFLYYYLKSPSFNSEFELHISGLIGGVSQGELREFAIPVPPLPEQKKISDFLDSKVTEIDKIIFETKASIENYKEYKQSLITEAVTKGLDKNVPMKDSGIEWIGEIPCEWKVYKLKHLLDMPMLYGANETGIAYDEYLPRYIRITDITSDNKLKNDGKLSLSEDVAEPYMLKNGDILFARSGGTVGKTFIYKDTYGKCAFAGYLIRARLKNWIVPELIYYYTLTSSYDSWKNRIFIQSTIQNIGADKYCNMEIAISATKKEQKDIVNFLDNKCAEIDNLISEKETLIVNLEEYKKSLIYEYVTGKKAVE